MLDRHDRQRLVSVAFLCCAAVLPAQYGTPLTGVSWVAGSVAGAVPGFVNESSKNSTLTTFNNGSGNGLGAQVASICFGYSYCIPLPEAALSGNLIVASGHYDNGSTSTPTTIACHDDQGDAFTTDSHQSVDTGSGFWVFMCYTPNVTAGAHMIYATFGTTAVTQVAMKAAQFDNIATSSPLDVSASCAGSSGSTANCASATTTQANDLCYNLAVRAGTPAVTSFTVSSGFTFGTEDINDGAASQWKVVSSAGSVTPAMTMASSSTYLEHLACFKSASAGTAPSGTYIAHLMSWGPLTTSATSFNFQFPSVGNLLVMTNAGSLIPGAVPTDSVNTWATTGSVNNGGSSAGSVLEYYVQSATANPTGLITAHTTGSSGDTTFALYDIVNAPAAPFAARGALQCASGGCETANPMVLNYVSQMTNGFEIMAGGQAFNTFLSCTPTGCLSDAASWGDEPVDGGGTPSNSVDQNNIFAHYRLSNPTVQSFSLTNSADITSTWAIDVVSFLSSSGLGIIGNATNQATSGNSLAVTTPSMHSGDLLVVSTGFYDNATVRTVSSVRTGTSCSGGTTFTQVPSALAADIPSTLLGTDIWYLASAPSGGTSVIVCYSGATVNSEAEYWEVEKGGGGTWALDNSGNGAHVANGTVSSGTATGASITTTGVQDFCVGHIDSANNVTANPKSGNAYTFYGAGTTFTSGGAVASLLTVTDAAQTPAWSISSGGAFNESSACWD